MRAFLSTRLALLIPWCVLPMAAHAEPDSAPWAARLECQTGDLWERYRLPDGLRRDVLVREIPAGPLLSTSMKAEVVCGVFAREWKSQKAPTYLAFLETAIFQRGPEQTVAEDHHRLRIAVYRQDQDGQYRLAARTADPLELTDAKLEDLDLAPYKLADGDYAFGVRSRGSFECHEDSYCTGASARLDLFRVVGSGVGPVLTTLLWSAMHTISAANDDWSRDHATIGDEEPAQISVLKTRTKGIFDWKKKKKKRPAAIFKWNGARYELQGEDPVVDYSNETNRGQ